MPKRNANIKATVKRRSTAVWISLKTTKNDHLPKNKINCQKKSEHTIIKIYIPTQTPHFWLFVDKIWVVHEKQQNNVDKYLSKSDKTAKN